MRAAIYARISDDRTGAGLGVRRQEDDCRALAERRGWQVTEVYVDNDVSAYSGKPRPAYRRLLEDVKAGRLDVIMAWHTDRLHRSPRELEDYITACEDVPTVTVRAGDLDLSTPSGRMVARMLGAAARHESEHKSERQRRKALQLAEEGKVGSGGFRPFGYTRNRTMLVPSEAAVLRDLYQQVLNGRGLRSLVRDLDEMGVKATTGGPWSQQGLRYNLLSPRNAGLREHRGVVVGPAVWPAIVDRDTWEQACAMLKAQSTGVFPARKYLLTGFLFCGLCGNRLRPARSAQTQRFSCRKEPGQDNCGGILIRYDPTEEHVVDLFLRRLDQMRFEPLADDPTGSLLQRIADDEARLEALAAAFADDVDANPLELRAAGAKIRHRIEQARADLARITVTQRMSDPVKVRQEWESGAYDLEQKRAALAEVVERVDVASARRGLNRFDPARLTVGWR